MSPQDKVERVLKEIHVYAALYFQPAHCLTIPAADYTDPRKPCPEHAVKIGLGTDQYELIEVKNSSRKEEGMRTGNYEPTR